MVLLIKNNLSSERDYWISVSVTLKIMVYIYKLN